MSIAGFNYSEDFFILHFEDVLNLTNQENNETEKIVFNFKELFSGKIFKVSLNVADIKDSNDIDIEFKIKTLLNDLENDVKKEMKNNRVIPLTDLSKWHNRKYVEEVLVNFVKNFKKREGYKIENQ